MKGPWSVSKSAVASRIRRLPKLMSDYAETSARRDAEALVKDFHDGIMKNRLGLVPLQDATVSRKSAMGFESPDSPLYGLGDEFMQGTYANMMEVRKDSSAMRYVVAPRDGYHYEVLDGDGGRRIVRGKIKLRKLFLIHEYGCTISNGFGRGIVIRIPPRPAFRYAYDRLMNRKRRADPSGDVRKAIGRYVRAGDAAALRKIAGRSP